MEQGSQISSSIQSLTKDKEIRYSDEELIIRFQDGDEQAFVELVNRYRNRLMTFVCGYVFDIDKAEDLVQDTFIKLYTKKDSYKPIAKFSTWIYTIAGNLAKTELRKKKRRPEYTFTQLGSNEWEFPLPAAEPETGETAENHLLMKQIYKAIQVLPEQSRIVVILRDMQELTYKEISMIVDVPLGTVRSRINRARLKLQEALEEFR